MRNVAELSSTNSLWVKPRGVSSYFPLTVSAKNTRISCNDSSHGKLGPLKFPRKLCCCTHVCSQPGQEVAGSPGFSQPPGGSVGRGGGGGQKARRMSPAAQVREARSGGDLSSVRTLRDGLGGWVLVTVFPI